MMVAKMVLARLQQIPVTMVISIMLLEPPKIDLYDPQVLRISQLESRSCPLQRRRPLIDDNDVVRLPLRPLEYLERC